MNKFQTFSYKYYHLKWIIYLEICYKRLGQEEQLSHPWRAFNISRLRPPGSNQENYFQMTNKFNSYTFLYLYHEIWIHDAIIRLLSMI